MSDINTENENNIENKKSVALTFKWRDAVVLIVALAVTVSSAFAAYRKPKNQAHLVVTAPDGEYIYALDKERKIEVKGQIGTSVVEIIEGTARFLDSPCDNKVCVNHGLLMGGFDFAACLPNGIFIMIDGAEDDGFDAMSK